MIMGVDAVAVAVAVLVAAVVVVVAAGSNLAAFSFLERHDSSSPLSKMVEILLVDCTMSRAHCASDSESLAFSSWR